MLWVLVTALPAVAAPGVRIYQSKDPAVTEGDTIVNGDPAAIFAAVLDYTRWTGIFPDVAKVVVTSQKGNEARVTLIAPDGHRDNLHFNNQPNARMIFFEDTGGRADVWAEIMFVPGDKEGTTRVHTRLYANLHGLASLVVSDGDIRKMREDKIERQLVHMRDYFRRR
ncbi:MAG: hypothetical protein JWO36_4847 [Myxococcales bacterium]|nr:hypothetical protein [Myxococcales bacterium]